MQQQLRTHGADGGVDEVVGGASGAEGVREGLFVALAHEVGEELVVQVGLHVEIGRQQQRRPHPACAHAAQGVSSTQLSVSSEDGACYGLLNMRMCQLLMRQRCSYRHMMLFQKE